MPARFSGFTHATSQGGEADRPSCEVELQERSDPHWAMGMAHHLPSILIITITITIATRPPLTMPINETLSLWEAYRMHTSPDAYTFETTMGGKGAKAKEYLTIHRNAQDGERVFSTSGIMPEDSGRKEKTVDVLGG